MTLLLSGTDGLSDVDGSAATPAIRGTDANTGMFFPAADTIAFAEGGAESARFDSSGNLLVGRTSNTGVDTGSQRFVTTGLAGGAGGAIGSVSDSVGRNIIITDSSLTNVGAININTSGMFVGTSASSPLIFNTNGTERMRITADGNLAIGTTSPSSALTVQRPNGTATYLQLFQTSLESWQIGMPATVAALTFRNSGTEQMRLDTSGNLMIGTTSVLALGKQSIVFSGALNRGLCLQTTTSDANMMAFVNSSGTVVGQIYSNVSSTAYQTSSDYRLKENIAPMTGALDKVSQLKPVTYKWKTDGSDGQGFIAHELAEVVPDCVYGEKDAVDAEGNPQYQGIDTSFLVATLTAAIQEQQALIQQLQADVAALKGV
jgi:hypothetical protein